MKNELALTATDFMRAGKINFEGFTNVTVERAFISENEFKQRVNLQTTNVLTKAQVDELQKSQIEKSEGTGQPAKISVQRVVVELEKGGLSEVFLMSKPVEVKGNTLEKGEGDDIEKGILDNYNNKFEFKKTGKEIKDKLTLIKTSRLSQVTILSASAAVILQTIDEAPSRVASEWEYGSYKDKIGDYLLFDYDKCYFSESSDYNGSVNGSMTKEQCDSCSKYNDLVYRIISLRRDVCECDVFLANLVDTDKYQLTTTELVNLGF